MARITRNVRSEGWAWPMEPTVGRRLNANTRYHYYRQRPGTDNWVSLCYHRGHTRATFQPVDYPLEERQVCQTCLRTRKGEIARWGIERVKALSPALSSSTSLSVSFSKKGKA